MKQMDEVAARRLFRTSMSIRGQVQDAEGRLAAFAAELTLQEYLLKGAKCIDSQKGRGESKLTARQVMGCVWAEKQHVHGVMMPCQAKIIARPVWLRAVPLETRRGMLLRLRPLCRGSVYTVSGPLWSDAKCCSHLNKALYNIYIYK